MSDSRNSWIDRGELEELLRQLLPDPAPGPSHTPTTGDEPLSLLAPSSPEGEQTPATPSPRIPAEPDLSSTHAESSHVASHNQELKRQAMDSLGDILRFNSDSGVGDLPGQHHSSPTDEEGQSPASSPAHDIRFDMPSGPLHQRLQAFVDWIRKVTGATQVNIVDAQGYTLLTDAEQDTAAVGSALHLATALHKFRERMDSDEVRAGIHLPLGNDRWFGVIDCEASQGIVFLSLVTPGPLSPFGTQEITRVLWETLEA
ncbi:MAG: hypothetical protein AAGJ31_00655 [Verrucomicrobiota bacterium]